MRGLPIPGGNNGFATGADKFAGWAENGVHDDARGLCNMFESRPAMRSLGPPDVIHELPLFQDDTSGRLTAINDNGQIVGISGICDQAAVFPKHGMLGGMSSNGLIANTGNAHDLTIIVDRRGSS